MSAAPTSISEQATIIDNDGTILRKGNNGWTCLPDVMPNDMKPIFNDTTWMKMLGTLGKKQDFTPPEIGLSYMLIGDIGAEVSNSVPFHADHKKLVKTMLKQVLTL